MYLRPYSILLVASIGLPPFAPSAAAHLGASDSRGERIAQVKQLQRGLLIQRGDLRTRDSLAAGLESGYGGSDAAAGGGRAPTLESAAPVNVQVSDPSLDDPTKGDAQAEPSLAAWGDYVLAAWNDGRGVPPNPSLAGFMAYGYSTDGGQTFTDAGDLPLPPTGGQWTADPVVAVDEKTGEFYFCALFDPIDISDFEHGVATARATFSGNTISWATPHVAKRVTEPSFINKPWMAVDSLSGNLYLTYTRFAGSADSIIFIRSTDQGVSWGPQITLSSAAAAGLVEGSRPVVGPNGEVYVVWKEIGLGPTGEDYLRIRKSTDFGVSFGPERTVASFYDNFGTGAPGYNRERGIAFPAIAVDRSTGPWRGRVYVAWNECVNFYDSIPDEFPVISEVELGDSVYNAQNFTPGATIVGSFGSLTDLDWYRFSANQGATYLFWADQIPARYTMRVFCSDGVTRLAFSGDRFGSPPAQGFIAWTCPASGTYYLRMAIVGITPGAYRVRTGIDQPGGPGQRARDHRDVFVAASDDGTTWSAPTLVHPSEDPWFDDWLPEVAVADQGALVAMWYDWADAPPSSCGGQSLTTMARSDDGGASWASLGAVSDAFTDWTSTSSNAIPNQGDYLGLFANLETVYPCWTDGRLGTPDIWTAPFSVQDVPTPTIVTQFVAEPVDGGVRVQWILARADAFARLVLERAGGEAGPWQNVEAEPVQEGNATLLIDRSVEGGRTYWYRLVGTTRSGAVTRFGPVQARTLAADALALDIASPNPTPGPLIVDFAVAQPSRVALELIDVQGRVVARLADGVFGPGRHRVQWDARGGAGGVPPGIYVLSCSSGGRTLTRRVAICR